MRNVPTVRVDVAAGRAIASGRRRELRLPADKAQLIGPGVEVRIRSTGRVHCRAEVESLGHERLRDLDAGAARREGFRGVGHFEEEWRARHGFWDKDAPVAVLRLRPLPELEERFLAARPGRSGDYVTNPHRAMGDEGAAVDVATQARYAREGRERHDARLAREGRKLRGLPAEQQVSALAAQARARHVDVRSDLRQFHFLSLRRPEEASRHLENVRRRLGL